MHPLQYMRPTAAPSAGNVADAERIIAALRAEGALERRFARLEDIEALWRPSAPAPPTKTPGIFGHLLRRDADDVRDLGTPTVTMTSCTVATIAPMASHHLVWDAFCWLGFHCCWPAGRGGAPIPPGGGAWVGLFVIAADQDEPVQ
jgi:hypothetical protein